MEVKMKYTREELITLCNKAIVPQDKWTNRDSPSAQEQLGLCHHLLRCNCKFWVLTVGDVATNDRTIWLSVEWKSFSTFEVGGGHMQNQKFYLPTEARLKQSEGRDWY